MYVDYVYYTDTYGGKLVSQEEFEMYERKASMQLHEYALPQKISKALNQEAIKDRVKLAICELMDNLKEFYDRHDEIKELDTIGLEGITSESVKDHSVTYASDKRLASERLREAHKGIANEIVRDRLRMTGLLSRGL